LLKDLQDIVHELKQKGVALRATEQPIDTGIAAGKAFLDVVGVFAELETNLRRERQMEGMAAAKAWSLVLARRSSRRRWASRPRLSPAACAANIPCTIARKSYSHGHSAGLPIQTDHRPSA
jgi:DNA invertase Pin-like site-specific DNA recombinase